MKQLLGKQGLRMLDMITYLYHREWVTLEQLSAVTKFTERTLREDIKYLNTILTPITIESSKKSGIRLTVPTNYSLNFIYTTLLSNSIEFTVLEATFFQSYKTIDDLAVALHSDTSIVTKAIKKINKAVDHYHFQISPNSIKLVGDEQAITVFIKSYLLKKYDKNMPLDKDLIESIHHAITRLFHKRGATITPINRNLLILYMAIRIRRLKLDQTNRYLRQIDAPQPPAISEFNQELSTLAEINDVYDFYSDIFHPGDDQYICFSIDELYEKAAQSPALNQKISSYTNLLTSIEKELNFSFNSKDAALFRLHYISLQEAYHIPIIGNKTDLLLNHVKLIIPYVYLVVSNIVESFSEELQIDTTALLYYVFSSSPDFFTIARTKQPKLKVALYGQYHNLTTINNLNILTATFEHQFDITFLESTFEDLREEINRDYDLLITEINNIDIEIDNFCMPFDISSTEIASLQQYYFNAMSKIASIK
ncbi:helix-turn-helix domain-containing protein [Vagococcus sp. BWB3-3]|uniref:Helix-turn-helix domain-containing protein n=1 Tax=Vagococcus allomyrinae TaxID=2794353 RepID=A0A940P0V8_9ENTE|nr:helix-turn-helix domain-containing protein [Vagococcus allomyrinae]MBP1039412.1 helix-turn-helix domain-containing protein [Vagococcus allomyrinae]